MAIFVPQRIQSGDYKRKGRAKESTTWNVRRGIPWEKETLISEKQQEMHCWKMIQTINELRLFSFNTYSDTISAFTQRFPPTTDRFSPQLQ
jgi:hypothetical protein